MADHLKAHPAVLLTMTDGSPVPMTTPVDDIILKAEESGLIAPVVQEPSEVTA